MKRSITTLEKEKETLEDQNNEQVEELKKDKLTLREFVTIKDKTIKENAEKIESITKSLAEFKVQLAQQKQKYEKQISELKNKVGLL